MAGLDHAFPLGDGRTARVRFTTAADGDLAVSTPSPQLEARRRAILPLPWTWFHQVHGATVVSVEGPGGCAGVSADGAVTGVDAAPLVIHTADCAPVALVADEGVVGVAHAGWRGLVAGVVERTADALRAQGAHTVRAIVGPCIHPCCYEFGEAELDLVADRYGGAVRGVTTTHRPALDLPAGVAAALGRTGVELVDIAAPCTACDPRFFSHRARADTARQAMLVWVER